MKKDWYKYKVLTTHDRRWIDKEEARRNLINHYQFVPKTNMSVYIKSPDGKWLDLQDAYGIEGFEKVGKLANEDEQKILDKAEMILWKYGPQVASEVPPFDDDVEILDPIEYQQKLERISKDQQITVSGTLVMQTFADMRHRDIIRCESDKALIDYIVATFGNQKGLSPTSLRVVYTNYKKSLK